MKLIVGLGNPGTKYKNNRHNLGFILVDKLARELNCNWKLEDRFKSEMVKYKMKDGEFIFLCKPTTFMNNSGEAISLVKSYFKIEDDDVIVVHDDLDLSFLQKKKQKGASSAGHNGVQSVIDCLGTDEFWRLRVGIGRPLNQDVNSADWVLKDFTDDELLKIKELNILPILVG
ncbi:aminoacyl-tRNA hydrolase [candidate division WWE3 bacterium]|nr:aminoacyl-tRNA hydrolase [candidate division WWE3 bacterium]